MLCLYFGAYMFYFFILLHLLFPNLYISVQIHLLPRSVSMTNISLWLYIMFMFMFSYDIYNTASPNCLYAVSSSVHVCPDSIITKFCLHDRSCCSSTTSSSYLIDVMSPSLCTFVQIHLLPSSVFMTELVAFPLHIDLFSY